ncbi:heme-thiolate peroxidase [Boletus reticuloceps]|uniref:Heme-thiolate peroxidase n=1 Tax=Boletus reticuloceps TaxID=495285 RepID=A0A8I2YKZ0_9AGAM|nr:heme-thiolate peroxidase [Boletus reticuloceps]
MKFQNLATVVALIPYVLGFPHLANFPEYRSLAGLSPQEIRAVTRQFNSMPGAQPLPPPINDTSSKLINDADHPFMPLQPGDIRGPCPGLNTLASHGYINRTGVTTPGDIITAVQEGFNMGYQFASFLCYSAFVTDGNQLTNLMTIGANTTTDGQLATGINTHGNFEGDASLTRDDAYLGNNFNFNKTLFDVFDVAAKEVGNGVITFEAAALNRALRINDSIARNPEFAFETPRFLGGIAETGFFLAMFVNNQTVDNTMPLRIEDARSFFDFHRFPDGFYRRQGPFEFPLVKNVTYTLIDMIGRQPGNNNGVNNYVVNPEDPATFCYFYQKQVNATASLYPNPTPELGAAIKANLVTYYNTLEDPTCEQYFPYGQ